MHVRNHHRGFTILEVAAVLVLVGILATLSVRPMRNYLRRIDFRNSAENVKRLIQAAQSRAMANPTVHVGVYFDLSHKPQRVFLFEDKANPNAYQYDGPGDPQYLQPETLKPGIALEALPGQPREIVFRGDGSAWKSLKICITDGTLRDTLDVLASTGRVRMGR